MASNNATSTTNTTRVYLWHEQVNDPTIVVLLRFVFPPFIFLGMFGNGFCFISIVTRRLYRKSPVFMFYMFLALSDFIEVTCESMWIFEDYFGVGIHTNNNIACKFVLWLDHSAMYSSSWLLVSVTAFRLYGIARPLDMMQRNGLRISAVTCTVIVSLFTTLCINAFWTNGVVISRLSPTVAVSLCFVLVRAVAKYYATAMLLFYSLGPGFLLMVLSFGIISSFVLSYRRHKQLLKGESVDANQHISSTYVSAKNSVAMLVPLAVLQLACTFPLFIYVALFGFVSSHPAAFFAFNRMRCINHSLNFYIQSIVSKFYRETMLPFCAGKAKQ